MTLKITHKKEKKDKKESTKERILFESLKLFNQLGERNVTTNHIAAELGMSPGNLYYHFKNKHEIIFDLFLRYQTTLERVLQPPRNIEITFDDKMKYFEGIFEAMWQYRFLHRDLAHLLESDKTLRRIYSDFAAKSMAQACEIYQKLVDAGMIVATEEEIQTLVLNIWVVTTSWASFLYTANPEMTDRETISREMLKRGIYQIICMEAPYLSEISKKEHLPRLKETYFVGGSWPLSPR